MDDQGFREEEEEVRVELKFFVDVFVAILMPFLLERRESWEVEGREEREGLLGGLYTTTSSSSSSFFLSFYFIYHFFAISYIIMRRFG